MNIFTFLIRKRGFFYQIYSINYISPLVRSTKLHIAAIIFI